MKIQKNEQKYKTFINKTEIGKFVQHLVSK
jgi:hypothetical protein